MKFQIEIKMNMGYKVEIKHTENSDKFRQPAVCYEANGYYTAIPKGTTEYRKYWDEEYRCCLFGYQADDGDWIPGYFYFYLNYSPILTQKDVKVKMPNGKVREVSQRIRNFPTFWDYDRAYFETIEGAENEGRHLVVIKKRQAGYSFKGASMLCRNFYLIPDSKSYAIAGENEFLSKDGLLTKAWDLMDWINEKTPWSKKCQKINQKMHKRASIVINKDGVETEIGYKSEIIGVSLKNDPQKARGKKAKLILWEESGKFPNLKTAWQIARPSVEASNIAVGLMIAYGTGGSDDADYEGLKDLFYEPKAYNALSIDNIWDEENFGTEGGFFVPEYYNMEGSYKGEDPEYQGQPFMDKDGNSNIPLSKKFALEERKKVSDHASDRTALDRYVSEKPFTPAEATLNIKGNIFPKTDLITHLANIRNSKKLKEFKQVGDLVYSDNGILKWEIGTQYKDLNKYRLEPGQNKEGAIVIWEHPVDDPPYGLYVAGCDPYDHDHSTTDSLGSVIIYKRFQNFESYYDLPVAEYTGRPETADGFYEKVRRLIKYFNAKMLYENEKKGLYVYFTHVHEEYLLADQPDIINDILQHTTKVDRKKGIHMNKEIKLWGERLIRDWLNEEYAPGYKNLTKIFSEALLEELISYNEDGNFDRCSIEGTKISVIDGYKNVEDISLGDIVLTHTGRYKKVSGIDSHRSNRKILKFKTIGNYEPLIVTDNHPIYVAHTNKKKHCERKKALNNIGFVEAGNLNNKYQFALQPKRKQGNELKWPTKYIYDDDLMYLIGWYVSDGYVNGNQISICLQKDQMSMALKLKSILNRYGEQNGKLYNNRQYQFEGANIIEKDGYIKVRKGSAVLAKLLEESGGKSNNKQLSKDVYNSPNTLMLAVGYLEGDGHQKKFAKYDTYKREVIEVSGIYETLIKQIRQILIDNGIWSSIRYISSKLKNHQDQYILTINRKYINRIAKYSLKFKEVDEINLVEKNYQYETKDGFWTPIKLIEEVQYDKLVYNFEVEDDNSYIASNIAIHNCMSLMMVMIYKEELHHVHVKEKKEVDKSRWLFSEPLFKDLNKIGWL